MAIDRDVIRFVQSKSDELIRCTFCGCYLTVGTLIREYHHKGATHYSYECIHCLYVKLDNFIIKRVWERKIKEARNGDEA